MKHKLRSKNIQSIITDVQNDSILWIGTVSSLIRFNKHTEKSELITKYFTDAGNTHQTHGFMDLFQDPYGLLYTGAHGSHLLTYNPENNTFGESPASHGVTQSILNAGILAFAQTNDSTLWITTIRGLVEYDFLHHTYRRTFENNYETRSFYGINYIDKDARILVQSIWGLFVFDPIQQQFELSTFKDFNPGNAGYVYSVSHDTIRDRYYACARNCNGLYYLDIKSGVWHRIILPSEFYTTENPAKVFPLQV